MSKNVRVSTNMFFLAGVLWVLEAVAELFGGYVEDFSTIFDYISEATFGLSYLALFLGSFFLVKHHYGSKGSKQGWLGKIGLTFLFLSTLLLTSKAIINVVYHSLIGDGSLYQFGSILNPLFLLGVLTSLLGTIIFGLSCLIKKVLPWWLALLLLVSMFFVFVPVVGKYVAAIVYALVGSYIYKKQVTTTQIDQLHKSL